MCEDLPHYILIRSTYVDAELSRQRLELSRLTIAPSLKHQRTPFTAVVLVNPEDPHLADRVALFEKSCQSIVFLESRKPKNPRSNLPANDAGRDERLATSGAETIASPLWASGVLSTGKRLITRVDDDDVVAAWMTERLQRLAIKINEDSVLYWPNGYVLGDQLRWRTSETNQFQTLLTSSPDPGETPFREHHAHVRDRWPVVEVDAARAWCWVQHPQAKTWRADRRWSGRIEDRPTRHFTADLSAVRRHLAGQQLTAYQQTLNEWTLTVGRPSMTITPKLWQAIRKIVRPGMRTLECGSGLSTVLFDRLTANHTALEHDPDWLLKMQSVSGSVRHCEIDEATSWYSGWAPEEAFDVILIDGPTGNIGRTGILPHIRRLTHPDALVIVDDTHRAEESGLSLEIGRIIGKSPQRIDDQGKSFDLIR